MSEDGQDLNSSIDELTDEIKDKPLTRVIRVLQEAGLCVYSSYDEENDITFAVTYIPMAGITQNHFNNN